MEPSDTKLYNKTKKQIYKRIPKHSAYRSSILVQTYKKKFKNKYGTKKSPYKGNKSKTKKTGLSRWFKEKWVNQRGEVGYKYKNDIYRPSKKITKKTPLTHKELSKKEIYRARTKKYRKGRVYRFRKEKKGGKRVISNKTKSKTNKKRKHKKMFADYPDFIPNLSPQEMFELGSFGGTYWRPIYSGVLKKKLKPPLYNYPKKWWKNIPKENLVSEEYDKNKNKYKVKVGTSLEFWESKKWINASHPYGWVQWYCDFYMGKRSDDDERQIKRWLGLAGPRGRFMRFLVTQILKKKTDYNDATVSPKIRQVLQHWGYKLTKKDFDNEVERRKNKK
jgi:hypothetical protein